MRKNDSISLKSSCDTHSATNTHGSHVIINEVDEGKLKQPDPISIVAEVCNIANTSQSSKSIAITLGANRAPIDAVRALSLIHI